MRSTAARRRVSTTIVFSATVAAGPIGTRPPVSLTDAGSGINAGVVACPRTGPCAANSTAASESPRTAPADLDAAALRGKLFQGRLVGVRRHVQELAKNLRQALFTCGGFRVLRN